ncbi:lysoplasmalogenase [Yinghuangia soli]|uniref:Lysoplasmalogenase n=1 Tax=Yinghuangia soli TaxID=2908204 RepID=A0AA41Q0L4_9ACTN|nr:lysoplasmalogenase [Yinghuangia soli]MCF2529360.1 lysoplasmalogenase [Yinghuangia soli]
MKSLVRRAVKRVCSEPRLLLGAYLAVGAVDSVLAAVDAESGVRWVTKPLLMPLLAGYVAAAARPGADLKLPLAALAGGFAGDVGLLTGDDKLFLAGMAGFAVGHVAYLKSFADAGAHRVLAAKPWVPAGYAAACAGMLAVLGPRLDDLLVPVAGYSLLLTAVAAAAAGSDRRTALGGALFLASDTVIALDLAGLDLLPGQDAAIMPLYIAAQLLLMSAWTQDERRAREEATADVMSTAASRD